jgi:mRNA interferase MazF
MIQKISHGDIWLANLNPGKGAEPGKTRPVLIVQEQVLLDIAHPSTIVIPLTTRLINQALPLRVRITAQDNLEKDSDLLIDQVRAIDNNRLRGDAALASLSEEQMQQVYGCLAEIMGMPIYV